MRTKIKICGVRDPEIAYFAATKGADYIGIVCAKRSKRFVERSDIFAIAQAVKQGGAEPVLIFENEQPQIISELCQVNLISYVQLHGNLFQYDDLFLPVGVKKILAITVSHDGECNHFSLNADYLLFDSQNAGSGLTFSWHKLKGKKDLKKKTFFLAGGLTSSNVLDAINCLNPYAVDVSSGVESTPGVKNKLLIEDFIKVIRGNGL